MATPRKRWFKVPDEVGASEASNDALAFYVRCGSLLSTRWAADGIANEDAGRCTLTPGLLAHLAGCKRTERAEHVAREFAARFGATIAKDGACYRIEWPKFASLQWPASDDGAAIGKESPPDSPSPRHATRDTRPATLLAGSTRSDSEKRSDGEKSPAGSLPPERIAELLDRVPGLKDTPTVRRKVGALPWRDVEHLIDQANADAKDGKATNPSGWFVYLVNDRLAELGIRV